LSKKKIQKFLDFYSKCKASIGLSLAAL